MSLHPSSIPVTPDVFTIFQYGDGWFPMYAVAANEAANRATWPSLAALENEASNTEDKIQKAHEFRAPICSTPLSTPGIPSTSEKETKEEAFVFFPLRKRETHFLGDTIFLNRANTPSQNTTFEKREWVFLILSV